MIHNVLVILNASNEIPASPCRDVPVATRACPVSVLVSFTNGVSLLDVAGSSHSAAAPLNV